MLILDELLLSNPNEILLEISPQQQQAAWPGEGEFSSDLARWNAYLNRLCLEPITIWLQEELEMEVFVRPNLADAARIWEVINGTAISCDRTRIVIIPSEAIDTEEFCVPREWVDIPSWRANYYLAVQVNPDDGYLRVWGYATHQQLKQQGVYQEFDRTYSLAWEDVITDLNVMWVARSLGIDEKVAVESLPALSVNLAESILAQKSQKSLSFLQLNLPFQQWGALLENDSWRQQLLALQVAAATPENRSLVNLSNWLENVLETGWQTIEAFLTPEIDLSLAFRGLEMEEGRSNQIANLVEEIYTNSDETRQSVAAYRLGEIGSNNPSAIAALIHLIRTTLDEETRWIAAESLWAIDPRNPASGARRITDFGMQIGGHSVSLMAAILPKSDRKFAILLRVYAASSNTYLPPDLKLIVLDEDGDIFLETESRDSDNYIQLKLGGETGERFSVNIVLEDIAIAQDFVI